MARSDYIGFRISTQGKKKVFMFAKQSKLTVGEFINLAIFEKIKDYGELSKIQSDILDKKR